MMYFQRYVSRKNRCIYWWSSRNSSDPRGSFPAPGYAKPIGQPLQVCRKCGPRTGQGKVGVVHNVDVTRHYNATTQKIHEKCHELRDCPETAAVRNRESYWFGSIPSFFRRSVCSVRMWSWVGVMLQFGTIFCMALFLMIATLPCQKIIQQFCQPWKWKVQDLLNLWIFYGWKKGLFFFLLSTHLRLMVKP